MNNTLNNPFYNINDNNIVKEKLTLMTNSFRHGQQFKKYQNKLIKNKGKKKVTFKEGFSNLNRSETNINEQALNTLNNANNTLSQQNQNLITEYNNLLAQYKKDVESITGIIKKYYARTDPSNPYLGKNICLSNGPCGYVTEQGVFKWYPADNNYTYSNTAGKNGCPNTPYEGISATGDINVPGSVINSNPNLIVGTPMVAGQSCGKEGKNIIVNKVLNDQNLSYEGCFNDNDAHPVMTFIGGSPPIGNNILINNYFNNPQVASGTFVYVPGNISITPWWCSGYLANNYSGSVTTPYPSGSQCVILSNYQAIGQLVRCPGWHYTLSFYACGNTSLNVLFYTTSNPTPTNNAYTSVQLTNTWKQYTFNFYVPRYPYMVGVCGSNFAGQINANNTQGLYIGIQAITFMETVPNTAPPSFTYDACQQQAILNGYKNFALQHVDSSTNLGYCAVSNNLLAATSLGKSYKYAPTILWSSGTNQSGNTATLNKLGSLVVNSPSGGTLFQTPAAPMTNYVGTYQDGCYSGRNHIRTMPAINNNEGWNVAWNYDSCSTSAQQQGYQYFGLQYFQPNGLGQCTVSNDINQAREFGPAANQFPTNSQGVINGNWCSNSIYSTNNATEPSFYWLVLQDDGNMCIYRGTGPGDIQTTNPSGPSAIWCSMTNEKQKDANPNFAASRGKTGKNWMASGTILAPGEFIGSTNGNIYLIMQNDGNLTLNTNGLTGNCTKMSNGYYGGGPSANAIYGISETGNAQLINNVYYVDPNTNITQYSSQNLGPSSNYTLFPNLDTPNNDLGASNNSLENCEKICDNNSSCGGFVFDNVNNTCWPKNKNMWPYTNNMTSYNSNSSGSRNIYLKMNKINKGSMNSNNELINTDSVSVMHYPHESNSALYNLAYFIASELQKLNDLESNINNLARQLATKNVNMINSEQQVFQQAITDKQAILDFLKDYKIVETEINKVDMQTNLVQDTDISVLQENYTYLLWSILAIGIVIVGINVVNKKSLF